MSLKDDKGELLFNVLSVGLTCKKCKLLKKPCTCLLYLRPVWLPDYLLRKQDAIMEGQDELREMETRGGIPAGTGELLSHDIIEDMKRRPRFVVPPGRPKIIFVGIDPNCGGSSDFVINSVASIHGVTVWLAGDRLNHGSGDFHVLDRFILTHFNKLHKKYPDAAFYISYEKNSNTSASNNRIYHLITTNIKAHINWAYHNPDDPSKPGILTTNAMKNLYASNIQNNCSNFRISSTFQEQEADESKSCVYEFWRQLGWFSFKAPEKNPNASNQDQKRIWSGKGPPGQNDDLVMGMGIAITFMIKAMFQDIEYAKEMKRRGITLI